ncbi:phosphonate ABC transporter, permease protein PhnE [Bifidobacterium avesanii]|uniref:Phosphonate ABC transporter, permease protein PhnE n=1 Tax=Bifidobacterium avesanii TaxID=1798157 RepID=A0A7K3TJH8_9BIFI|nr:phosphonate ABC transporter, permease protein PhnE [Bifidobacterium avesanii]KAB8288135.1 phosphonate ABC transporter permease [Bifidobacterium avesanii]NEG79277.1 phosphonate ABC transporter, permease protein PhnE [Bifidobacterium avesanii]
MISTDLAKLYADRPKATLGRVATAVIVVALLVWSAAGIESSGAKADSGWTIVGSILNGLTHPAPQLLFNLTTTGVPYLLVETVAIAFMGTVVGAVIAVPLAFLAASNLMPKPVAWLASFAIMAIRTVPVFVYGIMFVRVTGPGAFAGLMTMSLCSVGMVSKMFIEAIEDLDRGVLESLSAMGLNRWQQIRFGVLPQMMASFLSTAIYRFDMNLRDATILGLVGAGGIGAPLIFAMNAYRWNEAASILWGLIVLILLVEYGSTKLRNKLARG